jgi:hypothetical protein
LGPTARPLEPHDLRTDSPYPKNYEARSRGEPISPDMYSVRALVFQFMTRFGLRIISQYISSHMPTPWKAFGRATWFVAEAGRAFGVGELEGVGNK